MDSTYIFLRGIAWARSGEESAGLELIRATSSSDPERLRTKDVFTFERVPSSRADYCRLARRSATILSKHSSPSKQFI
jgi:hypothetical protein